MFPLIIRSQPGPGASFLPLAVVGLPVVVESGGWILPFHDEFRVWINRPGAGRTMQFSVAPSREINELDFLPLIAAGVAECGEGFIVTGADKRGLPVVAGTGSDGRILWQQLIDGPIPFRWPAPGCGRKPMMLWQNEQGRVEVADVGANGIVNRSSFAVGGPPLDLAVTRDSVWAIWSDASGIFAFEAADIGAQEFQLSESYTSEIALGACTDGVCVAWAQAGAAFLARKRTGSKAFEEPYKFELGAAAGGPLRVIPGDEPLIQASRARLEEGEPPRVLSVLTSPGLQPLVIEGIVHSVARRGEKVVLLGETVLRFLKRVR
jgi:hypothetical protein